MLESGDRARHIGKGGLEMGEDLRGRLASADSSASRPVARVASSRPRRAVRIWLCPRSNRFQMRCQVRSLRRPSARLAAKYAASDGGLQEPPQSHSGQAEPPDFVGGPDAERPPATAPCLAVAAEDPPGTHHSLLGTALVVSEQRTVPIQRADNLAVRTRRLLEPFRHRQPFLVAADKPSLLAHGSCLPENQDSTGMRGGGVLAGYEMGP